MSFAKLVMEKREEYNEYLNNTLKPLVIDKMKSTIKEYALNKRDEYLKKFIKSNHIYECVNLDIVYNNKKLIETRYKNSLSQENKSKDLDISSEYFQDCLGILQDLDIKNYIYTIYNEIFDGCIIDVEKIDSYYSIKILIK